MLIALLGPASAALCRRLSYTRDAGNHHDRAAALTAAASMARMKSAKPAAVATPARTSRSVAKTPTPITLICFDPHHRLEDVVCQRLIPIGPPPSARCHDAPLAEFWQRAVALLISSGQLAAEEDLSIGLPCRPGLTDPHLPALSWQPQRDSNPCLHLERVMSSATRRWGHAEDGAAATRCTVDTVQARGGGLEPPITGPEPVVLPITPPPNG